MSYLSYLECAFCGKMLEADQLWNLCPTCSKPLLARYDLETARQHLRREEIAGREATLWRYRELLLMRNPHYTLCLGEGWTPLIHAARLGEAIGFENLFVKDEGLNPAGSFKARALGVAVSRADFLILRTLRESNCTAIAISDRDMLEATRFIGSTQGIFVCPEGAATLVAFRHLRQQGWINEGERVVLFNTGSGLKYAHLWAA